jgi:hypothetical protein
VRSLDTDDPAQPRDRVSDARGRVPAAVRPVALLGAGRQTVLEHLDLARDDGERIVDLVGGAWARRFTERTSTATAEAGDGQKGRESRPSI